MLPDKPITAAQPVSPVPAQPGTQTPPSPVTPVVTQTLAPVDVEKLKTEYETKLAQYERDMNRMKSSLQKSQSQVEREARQREEQLALQLEAERVSHMDETQRKEYEFSSAVDRAQELERQLQDVQDRLSEQDAYNKAYTYFVQQGVPFEAMILDQGYDPLFQSGWGYINGEYNRLRTQSLTPPVAPPPPPVGVNAPPITTPNGGTPVTGKMTWAEIRTKYGSEDNFWRLVDRGRVDPSVAPGFETQTK